MVFSNDTNFYEVLEIKPDASAQDVRNAYLRLKVSYRKDNPALYSVLDPGETDDMIQKIEEAFQILSDPEMRREYDERNGFTDHIERKIFSIERAPPPAAPTLGTTGDDEMLVAPATDFDGMSTRGETTSTGINAFQLPTQGARERGSFLDNLPPAERPASAPTPPIPHGPGLIERRQPVPPRPDAHRSGLPLTGPPIDAVAAEVQTETEWKGATLRRVRELRRYSIDDLASLTKISKNHLIAIEEDSYTKLPAPVFVRGFLLQIARTLKIPPEAVAIAYLARLKRPGAP